MKKLLIFGSFAMILAGTVYRVISSPQGGSEMSLEVKNQLILDSSLNRVSGIYRTTGKLETDIPDAYGTPLQIEIKDRVLIMTSAGEDKTFHTNDDKTGKEKL